MNTPTHTSKDMTDKMIEHRLQLHIAEYNALTTKLFDADPATIALWEQNKRLPLGRSREKVLNLIKTNVAQL